MLRALARRLFTAVLTLFLVTVLVFALIQLCANFALLFMYVEFEVVARFSVAMDLLVGTLELASIIALLMAFFPPASYCQWLARSARQTT